MTARQVKPRRASGRRARSACLLRTTARRRALPARIHQAPRAVALPGGLAPDRRQRLHGVGSCGMLRHAALTLDRPRRCRRTRNRGADRADRAGSAVRCGRRTTPSPAARWRSPCGSWGRAKKLKRWCRTPSFGLAPRRRVPAGAGHTGSLDRGDDTEPAHRPAPRSRPEASR